MFFFSWYLPAAGTLLASTIFLTSETGWSVKMKPTLFLSTSWKASSSGIGGPKLRYLSYSAPSGSFCNLNSTALLIMVFFPIRRSPLFLEISRRTCCTYRDPTLSRLTTTICLIKKKNLNFN